MILPIVGYGDPVLRKVGEVITPEYPNLKETIANMYETMYNAYGVGLAAPQVGIPIRLFVIDTTPFSDDDDLSSDEQKDLKGFKKTFINAKIVNEEGEEWSFNEGCLSIPDIREDVNRHQTLTINYFDENWQEHRETYDGLAARVIQHEYDHIEGKLFTDKLSPLRKAMLKNRLDSISKGFVKVDYKMKFPSLKKKR